MKLKEFIELYAGDGVLMNLLSEDGMESDTAPIDETYGYKEYINNRWLNGDVVYFNIVDGELDVCVDIASSQQVNSSIAYQKK